MGESESIDFENNQLVYIHHIDSYEMNAIRKYLIQTNVEAQKQIYELYGTLADQENSAKVLHDIYALNIIYTRSENFVRKVVNCDYIIFNVKGINFEPICADVRRVSAALEAWSKEQDSKSSSDNMKRVKYFILISTPLTWALTEPESDEGEDEDNENEGYVLEDNYRRRKAHKNYMKHKVLERDLIWLQKKCRNYVKTIVVCPGVTYGGENDTFHYVFKYAFYDKPVPVLRPGNQTVPLLYVMDLAVIIKNIMDQFPEPKYRYIFAVQPTSMKLKTFIYNVCKRFVGDCSKIRFLREVEMRTLDKSIIWPVDVDCLCLNLKMKNGYLKDFAYQVMDDKCFDNIVQQYRDERKLRPLKIVVDGPPLVGKTVHAQSLAQNYQLIYVDIRSIANTYLKYLEGKINDAISVVEIFECPDQIFYEDETDEEGEEVGKICRNRDTKTALGSSNFDEEDLYLLQDLKYRIEKWTKELFKLKVYVASHKMFEDQGFDFVSRCLIALLSTKQYNDNQGYILDGFPFTYEEANQIYYNTRRLEDFGIVTNTETNLEEQPQPPLKPTHVVILDATNKLLCKRAMEFKETEAVMRRCLEHQMIPRIDAYRERNDKLNCLSHLFCDNELVPITIFVEYNSNVLDTIRSVKIEIGPPFVYPLSLEEKQERERQVDRSHREYAENEKRKKEEMMKSMTLERERKIREWTAKYEQIMKRENKVREIKTLPLREYLGKYVLPTLTAGIVKVAEVQPEDPVDFLAEFLFRYDSEGQQAPPFCDEELRTRFYETQG